MSAAMFIGASALGMASAAAQPVPPTPPPAPSDSTSEELADMVLDVIESGTVAPGAVAPPR